MEALFIGQTYIDVTFLIDRIPTGDEKVVARDYAVSFGGNAVSAAFCCAKLGIVPELMTSLADDWLARMFLDMAAKYGISVHGRKVKESSLSFVMPNKGMRAIIRGEGVDWSMMGLSVITNILWMLAAGGIYLWVLRSGRERGMLTRVTSH